MDFNLSDEQQMLTDSARRYVSDRLVTEKRRAASVSEDGHSRQHWSAFAEMGWLALAVPEDAGGVGCSDAEIAILMEELGRGLNTQPYADTAVLGATLIAAADDADTRQSLLNSIASGKCISSLAHVEPQGVSEYETPTLCRALHTENGWTINGTKARVVHAGDASHWLVSACVDDSSGPSMFVVDRGASGAAMARYELVDGTWAADIVFVETPARALIVDPDRAAAALELALDRTIVAFTAAVVGSMEAVMVLTADYLKQRTQFGQPLAKFQALQHRMAEMFIETDQARSMLLQAIAALESGDASRRRRAASGAKALVTRAAYFVTGQGIQLHGGMGITDEYAVSHHYKSTLSFDQRFGDRDFHVARSAGLAVGPI
ncbi:acyl-CoA dehydrogenase [Paraburkholderia phymatum]|uniref:acyl-CoA dehydrogenase family protein n=1 Tax=Paraburkholderia phymatum TaxID=148447 RepID=UPI0031827CB8